MSYSARHHEVLADLDYRAMVADLRQARESLGLTQGQVADKVGVFWTAVSNWERYAQTPSLFHLLAWWRVLNFECVRKLDQ